MKNAILFGSTSEIGRAVIRELCDLNNTKLTLVGSGIDIKSSLGFKGEQLLELDWASPQTASSLPLKLGAIEEADLVVVSLGFASKEDLQLDLMELQKSIQANLSWPLICVRSLHDAGKVKPMTQFVIISSALVGLPTTRKSYVYSTLKNSLELVIKETVNAKKFIGDYIFLRPGYVPTKLNKHLSPGSFPSTPEKVARQLNKKIKSGLSSGAVYAPAHISGLAIAIRLIPKSILKSLLKKLQH
jgi:decaprenylphospho-beta-D-erythro-pentofuranosid-2-ulose 2-reductase